MRDKRYQRTRDKPINVIDKRVRPSAFVAFTRRRWSVELMHVVAREARGVRWKIPEPDVE